MADYTTPSVTEGVFDNKLRETDIFFATNNPGKIKELGPLLAPLGARLRWPGELGLRLDTAEDGDTFAANARIKALACAEILKAKGFFIPGRTVTMADDSGLCIDALGGEPGIYSARFMGEDTPYTEKNARLLERLADVPESGRTARFVCVIACRLPDGRWLTAEGRVEGRIAHAPRGENGFGYDPVFYLPAYGRTMAELPPEQKNRVSHRANAVEALLTQLRGLWT